MKVICSLLIEILIVLCIACNNKDDQKLVMQRKNPPIKPLEKYKEDEPSPFQPLDKYKLDGDHLSDSVEVNPEPITTVDPKYPEDALKKKIEGTVYLRVHLTEDGNVNEAFIMKQDNCTRDMTKSALDAAKKWKFKPAMKNGRAIPVWIMIPIRFRLK